MTRMSTDPNDAQEPTEFHLPAVDLGPDQLEKMRLLQEAGERILRIIEEEVEPIAAEFVPTMQFSEFHQIPGDIVTEVIWPQSGWSAVLDVWYSICGHAEAITGNPSTMWSPPWFGRSITVPELRRQLEEAMGDAEREHLAGIIEKKLELIERLEVAS